jgi:hypothetical protein
VVGGPLLAQIRAEREKEAYEAIQKNDIGTLQNLLETREVNANSQYKGVPLLNGAIDWGRVDMLFYLLDEGADPFYPVHKNNGVCPAKPPNQKPPCNCIWSDTLTKAFTGPAYYVGPEETKRLRLRIGYIVLMAEKKRNANLLTEILNSPCGGGSLFGSGTMLYALFSNQIGDRGEQETYLVLVNMLIAGADPNIPAPLKGEPSFLQYVKKRHPDWRLVIGELIGRGAR